jgi:hypothetical protein
MDRLPNPGFILESLLWVSAGVETAGRRCLNLPFGELRQRLVKVPSVLRTAALGYAGFPSTPAATFGPT